RVLEQRQMAMYHAILAEFPAQVSVSQPKGGYFLWLDLGENVDAARVYQLALAKGVSVAPGSMFSADQRFSHCIRINTSFEWAPHTARAISILAALVAEEIKQ
ncbi:PLP-dependent aminotransferase family protein, partial [Enterobacteriaceae bacterium ML5]